MLNRIRQFKSKVKINFFNVILLLLSIPIILLIVLPLAQMISGTSTEELLQSIQNPEVTNALLRSLLTSLAAASIAFIFGTPLAYILARKEFFGKRLIEGLIDLPIMIPHPVIGIAILSLSAKDTFIGGILNHLGIQVMGSYTGIIAVLTFVGIPFYLNTAKAGFEAIPIRLEKVSRSLGAGPLETFWRITLPLAWKSLILGVIMCIARAISEFGAVVIVAYHPMLAPVKIYEQFTAYGLSESRPVAVWLILIALILFIIIRILSGGRNNAKD